MINEMGRTGRASGPAPTPKNVVALLFVRKLHLHPARGPRQ
jgi:hypothetical protein